MIMKFKKLIEKFDEKDAKACGKWDKGGRWYPNKKYIIPGSFEVRSPSRNWGSSYYKHFLSKKYACILAAYDPWLYLQTKGIPVRSKLGREIVSAAVENRIVDDS
jgi:hypothetical protein